LTKKESSSQCVPFKEKSSNKTISQADLEPSQKEKGVISSNSRLLTPEELASMKEDFRRSSKYMKGRFKHLAPKK
jgi:hypothetical protein